MKKILTDAERVAQWRAASTDSRYAETLAPQDWFMLGVQAAEAAVQRKLKKTGALPQGLRAATGRGRSVRSAPALNR